MTINNIKPKYRLNSLEIAVHLSIWAMVFSFPLIFWASEHSITIFNFLHFITSPICLCIVFYINYFVWIKKYLLKERLASFILLNLLLIALLLICSHFYFEWINGLMEQAKDYIPRKRRGPSPALFALKNGSLLILTCGLSVAIRSTANWYKSLYERQRLEKEKTEMLLKNLKSQLQPHFLFNTLNNIYALIDIDKEKAQQSIHFLSKLLRYVLKESDLDKVPLSDEIVFINNYIHLMCLRLGDNVSVSLDFPSLENIKKREKTPMIAPLLFINLIENAFKYGSHSTENSFIRISLKLEQDNNIYFSCSNTFFEQNSSSKEDTGIGIPNLKKRLDYLYGSNYSFETQKKGKVFFAYLHIEL